MRCGVALLRENPDRHRRVIEVGRVPNHDFKIFRAVRGTA